ncbi:formate dehydrogenase subunit delta [Polycyclovorans algicola]|uniref:formate dehydrogenase subunit delta n=1 Tax=Polycyclovorans algicola TaxID=616992 RepID=UPI0004A6FE3D|nr:formate dehydrogenase subunit delta [Polycyclovorans algicola]
MNAERLIEMANDIARNLADEPDPAARIAEHLQKFWAPRMRSQLAEAIAVSPAAALPTVMEALQKRGDRDA